MIKTIIIGLVSFYSTGAYTANGEKFNKYGDTCAHRRYAFGTKLKVVNLHNNKVVVCRVNDRGPFTRGRVLDLSLGAFQKIADTRTGVIKAKIEVLN